MLSVIAIGEPLAPGALIDGIVPRSHRAHEPMQLPPP